MNMKTTSAAVLVAALGVAALGGCASLQNDGDAPAAVHIQSQADLIDQARAEAAQQRLEARQRERRDEVATARLQAAADAWNRTQTVTPARAEELRLARAARAASSAPESVADTVDDDLSPLAPRPGETPKPTPKPAPTQPSDGTWVQQLERVRQATHG